MPLVQSGERLFTAISSMSPKYHDILQRIRVAVEALTAPGVPQIIKNYTDHGINHSQRMLERAVQIIDAAPDIELTSNEYFLLIAGIYLHDIGMFCDVARFPAIIEKAKEGGANFTVKFTAKSANNYTYEEQQQIRNNHQYIAHAWIYYAFHSGQTSLGSPIREISGSLLESLVLVCKYHSKLSIDECIEKSFTGERVRLIAAIVRIVDEMDIGADRIIDSAVENYNFPPESSLYWYIHRLSDIFVHDRAIFYRIRINRKDEKYKDYLTNTFIEAGFRQKNRKVLNILYDSGIKLYVHDNSGVSVCDFAYPLPSEIRDYLDSKLEVTRKNPIPHFSRIERRKKKVRM